MLDNDYKIFHVFWDGYYLNLLNLYVFDEESEKALNKTFELFDDIFLNYPLDDISQEIQTILKEQNWRPHLVACIAILKLEKEKQQEFVKPLWERVYDYSWVIPQLLVTLSKIDDDFIQYSETFLNEKMSIAYDKSQTDIQYYIDIICQYINYPHDDKRRIAANWNKRLSELSDKIYNSICMITQLIKQNQFEKLKTQLNTSEKISPSITLLKDILNDKESVYLSFVDSYVEDLEEGLKILKALETSNLSKTKKEQFSYSLTKFTFEIGQYIRTQAGFAMQQGKHLTADDVNPKVRILFQELIDWWRTQNNPKAVTNIAAAKAQVTNSIGYVVEKKDIGEDMLQWAASCETIGNEELAIRIYQGVMADFECESVRLSTGLFLEVNYVDTRPQSEVDIFNAAQQRYEHLTGEKLPKIKRVRPKEEAKNEGFFDKLKKWFG